MSNHYVDLVRSSIVAKKNGWRQFVVEIPLKEFLEFREDLFALNKEFGFNVTINYPDMTATVYW